MRTRITLSFAAFFVVNICFVRAASAGQSSPLNCRNPSSAQQVLDCALERHPAIRETLARWEASRSLEKAAKQRSNPELDAEGAYGRSNGNALGTTEASLQHVFELGGKRTSRINQARAAQKSASADVLKAQETVVMGTVLSLYRLRQAQTELAVVEEALQTFSRIQRQLSSHPRLTPEQQVLQTIFELAEGDYLLKKAVLGSEIQAHVRSIEFAVADAFVPQPAVLPARRENWPELPGTNDPGALNGERLAKAQARVNVAQAALSSARSESWPDLKAGPKVQADRDPSQPGVFKTYGFSVSVPVPLYQRNAGGREIAAQELKAAQIGYDAARAETATERRIEENRYRSAVEALGQVYHRRDRDKKTSDIQEFFERGIIPNTLIIEALRQKFEFTQDVHALELAAVEALWRVYAIDGRALKEKI